MNKTTQSLWQTIMDRAYSKFHDGLSYEQFLARLVGAERQAVLLGNMNYQIQNGGVRQWVDNGYACHAKAVLLVLAEMRTPHADAWRERLESFVYEHVNTDAKYRGFVGTNYWLHDRGPSWCDEDNYEPTDAYEAADALDEVYYSEPFHAEFVCEVENFLASLC